MTWFRSARRFLDDWENTGEIRLNRVPLDRLQAAIRVTSEQEFERLRDDGMHFPAGSFAEGKACKEFMLFQQGRRLAPGYYADSTADDNRAAAVLSGDPEDAGRKAAALVRRDGIKNPQRAAIARQAEERGPETRALTIRDTLGRDLQRLEAHLPGGWRSIIDAPSSAPADMWSVITPRVKALAAKDAPSDVQLMVGIALMQVRFANRPNGESVGLLNSNSLDALHVGCAFGAICSLARTLVSSHF